MNSQARINIVERQVADFRNMCGLGSTDAIQLKSLLLKLNVATMYRPLSDNFAGMSIRDAIGNRFMLVNSNNPIGRQHFTIAHELYHLFVESNPKPHMCTPDEGKDESEKCADLFASMLLMPSDGLMQIMPQQELVSGRVSVATIVRAEHYFSVSRTAILNRLSDLGVITRGQRDELKHISALQSAKELGYDTALYKKGNENLFIGSLGEKAKKLFDEGKISEGHYIEVINKLNYGGED